MEANTKESTSMVTNMARASLSTLAVIYMTANGVMIKKKVSACIRVRMGMCTLASFGITA